MIGSAIMGLDFRILAPRELHPDQALVDKANHFARSSHARIPSLTTSKKLCAVPM